MDLLFDLRGSGSIWAAEHESTTAVIPRPLEAADTDWRLHLNSWPTLSENQYLSQLRMRNRATIHTLASCVGSLVAARSRDASCLRKAVMPLRVGSKHNLQKSIGCQQSQMRPLAFLVTGGAGRAGDDAQSGRRQPGQAARRRPGDAAAGPDDAEKATRTIFDYAARMSTSGSYKGPRVLHVLKQSSNG